MSVPLVEESMTLSGVSPGDLPVPLEALQSVSETQGFPVQMAPLMSLHGLLLQLLHSDHPAGPRVSGLGTEGSDAWGCPSSAGWICHECVLLQV